MPTCENTESIQEENITRECPQCHFKITNQYLKNCPRCTQSLSLANLCKGCLQNSVCHTDKPLAFNLKK